MESKFLQEAIAELTVDSDIDIEASDALIDSGLYDGGEPEKNGQQKSTKKSQPVDSENERPTRRISSLNIIRMSDVTAKQVEWDWPGRFAKGKTHLLLGEPRIGKSTFVTDMVASYTAGKDWPDGEPVREECDVLLLVGEDGLEDTIRPRLDRAGADVSRVHVLTGRNLIEAEGGDAIQDNIRFDRDMSEIGKLLEANPDIGAVFVDPVSEYFGNVDAHKNAAVRGLLKPISGLCEKHNLTWVNIDHFRKDATEPAIYRGMGSLAMTAQARIAWAFVRDFDDEDRVLFLPLKNNLHKRVPGMAFRITDAGIEWEDGTVDITVEQATATPKGPKPDKLGIAAAWLKEALTGGCVESDKLWDEAEVAGISFSTLKRAKRHIGCISSKNNSSGKWFVSLPKDGVDEPF